MMKSMKRFINILLAFALLVTTIDVSVVRAKEDFEVSISSKEIKKDDNFLISIESNLEKDDFDSISINAQELGYEKPIEVNPELMEQSLSVSSDIKPGNKTIKIILETKDGNINQKDIPINVIAKKDDGDFSWDQAVIYFLLTDRFHNGDTSNDDPNGESYDKKHLESYHGGDFRGLINKLDYLKDLGVNTLWITPIVDNVNWNIRHGKDSQYAYHGYWAKDFTKIDEHLGDIETFKELLDKAHERNMKILVDVVINHTGYGLKLSDQGNGIKNYPTNEEKLFYKGLIRQNPKSTDLVRGELAGLPDFITEKKEVREKVIGWQRDWIEKTKTDKGNTIDYFRVDTVKHVDKASLNHLKNELVKVKPDFKMIGEYFDGSINSSGSVLDGGGMDGILDFQFKEIASLYTRGKFEEAEKKLVSRNEKMKSNRTTGQFLSSHDEHGFLAMKLAGDKSLFKVAVALQLTAKGQPVIYYGEEIGMSGKNAGDMDKGEFGENRYDFDWSKVKDNDMLDHYKKLLSIRNDYSLAFSRGTRNNIASSEDQGISIFSREYEDDKILVALNINDNEGSIKVKTDLSPDTEVKDLYSGKAYKVSQDGSFKAILPKSGDGATSIFAIKGQVNSVEIDQVKEKSSNKVEDSKKKDDKGTQQGLNKYLIAFLILSILIVLGVLIKRKKSNN